MTEIYDGKDMLKPLGERIRDLRNKKGWSLTAMSEAAGMDANQLDAIERGEVDSYMETLFQIAKAFKITLSKLFEGI